MAATWTIDSTTRLDAPARADAPPSAPLPPALRGLVKLALLVLESRPIRWVPDWDESKAVPVRDAAHLGELIAGLSPRAYGGIEMDASPGPWAQALRERGPGTPILIEFHPYVHDRSDRPLVFERIVPVEPALAAEYAWAWARGKGAPASDRLEMRIVPEGEDVDRPL